MQQPTRLFILVLIFFLAGIIGFNGCGGGDGGGGGDGDDNGTESEITETSELMDDFNSAVTDEEKLKALENLVSRCESIGILDKNGSLLNSVPDQIDITLDQNDLQTYVSTISEENYRTLGSIIDFLADMGVVLSSTQEVISFADVRQDIQDYVDWSFANPDNPANTLGLLIASGPSMDLPESPPVIAEATRVNLLTTMLIVGDILLGIDGTPPHGLSRTALSETAESILGFLFSIEPTIALLISDEDWSIYEKIKELIVLFGIGNSLHASFMNSANQGEFEPVESVVLNGLEPYHLYAGTLLIPQIDNTPEPIGDIKPLYTLKISDNADFPVVFDNGQKTLTFTSSLFPPEKPFSIHAEKLTENSNNSAYLSAEVKFDIPDLDALIEKHKDKIRMVPQKLQPKLQDPVFLDSVKSFIKESLKVSSIQIEITPVPLTIGMNVFPSDVTDAIVGQSITFEAAVTFDPEDAEELFDSYSFTWQIAAPDEDPQEFEDQGNEYSYTFQKVGDYDILVYLYGVKDGSSHYLEVSGAHVEVSEAPTGACCNVNTGTCTITTEKECDYGTYKGDNVACREDICEQPTGACCSNDGTCTELTEDDCIDGGGSYEGNNFVCDPNPCTQYTGACCGTLGVCYITGQELCETAGDTYQGTGTTCSPGLCPEPEEWVVLTVDNATCFDAIIITVRERADFNKEEKVCDYWYYGENTCTVIASKTEVQGDFDTRDAAYAWIDERKGEWMLNRWCPGNGYYKISGVSGAEYFMIF